MTTRSPYAPPGARRASRERRGRISAITHAVSVVAPILVLALPVVNITQVTLRREGAAVPQTVRVDFADGSEALCFTAEVPGQIRGPQFHYSWADELAAWDLRPDDSGANAWDNLQFATRLGRKQGIKSQILFTTTPKRIKMLRALLALYASVHSSIPDSLAALTAVRFAMAFAVLIGMPVKTRRASNIRP